MAAVNDWVVREYFESLGFLVSQPRKYTVPGRPKTADEEVDLVVLHPHVAETRLPDAMVWGTEDLKAIACAVVGVRGWHTQRFSVRVFEQTPDVLRFAEPESIKFAAGLLNTASVVKILCLPDLPASGDLRKRSIEVLKEKGINGVISFRTMLRELVRQVDVNRNYERSDLLQILRLLKNYDLVQENQMELFTRKRHRRRPASALPSASA